MPPLFLPPPRTTLLVPLLRPAALKALLECRLLPNREILACISRAEGVIDGVVATERLVFAPPHMAQEAAVPSFLKVHCEQLHGSAACLVVEWEPELPLLQELILFGLTNSPWSCRH